MKTLNLFWQSRYSIVKIIILWFFIFSIGIPLGYGQVSAENDTLKNSQVFYESDMVGVQAFDTTSSSLDENLNLPADNMSYENGSSFWDSYIFEPMRLGLIYDVSYKIPKPDRLMNNRLSFRVEYSKLLFNLFTLQLDAKILSYLAHDHRNKNTTYWINDEPKQTKLSFGGKVKDFYLQTSFNKTSIKAGLRTLAWGESDFATVTDEISPLDYREPLNLNIDELKLSELMLTIDQYTKFGSLSGFLIPYPRFNEHAKIGTGYYFDPFNGNMNYQTKEQNEFFPEFGLKWKKTFGKSDISIITTSLINNEYVQRMNTPNVITREKLRYTIVGITFNRAIDKFLVKGEAAIKIPKAYNDTSFQVVKKNAFDVSFGVDYYVNSSLTLSVEAINNHVFDWNNKIAGTPKDNYMLLLVFSKQLMRNDLSVNLATMYGGPYTCFFNFFSTSYNWNDHLTLNLNVLVPTSRNNNSAFYLYRDYKQVGFTIQYQF